MTDGSWDRHVRRVQAKNRRKYTALLAALEETMGDKIEVMENGTGLHLLVRVPDGRGQDELIAQAAVAEAKARGVEGEPGHKGESEGKHGRENLASRVGRGLFHPERAAFEALQGVDGKPAHGPCARHHPQQGHHLGPELLCEVDGSHLSARHHPGGRDLEPLVVALPSLGRSEHLSPLTWCPENNTLSTTRP